MEIQHRDFLALLRVVEAMLPCVPDKAVREALDDQCTEIRASVLGDVRANDLQERAERHFQNNPTVGNA
jgi:hypothetical protein